jgi:hypothetical protein
VLNIAWAIGLRQMLAVQTKRTFLIRLRSHLILDGPSGPVYTDGLRPHLLPLAGRHFSHGRFPMAHYTAG